ncbi:MAG: polyprenyl synthetase family protein [Actinobacteria bacterium]|nr:polyprenyl synthetase family protein [Actinomycetota bacterium]
MNRLEPPPSILARAKVLVDASLREAVDSLHPGVRHMIRYHMGWVDAAGKPDARGGKAVRPAFAVLSAEAAGADASVAVPGAVAIELVHNFSLLHDDIMDEDRERRHRTTVWALYGVPAGIIAGDALMILAFNVLQRRSGPAGAEASRRLLLDTGGMIAGQVEDLAFEDRPHAIWDECVAMEEHKTAALFSCSACMGAILAEAPRAIVDGLAGFGMHVGLAFQAVDDLLGIWGSPELTGKPTSSDLRQSKKSLPICGALEGGGPGRDELATLLADFRLRGPREAELARAVHLVESGGGRERTETYASDHLRDALEILGGLPITPAAHDAFADLARFLGRRDH